MTFNVAKIPGETPRPPRDRGHYLSYAPPLSGLHRSVEPFDPLFSGSLDPLLLCGVVLCCVVCCVVCVDLFYILRWGVAAYRTRVWLCM